MKKHGLEGQPPWHTKAGNMGSFFDERSWHSHANPFVFQPNKSVWPLGLLIEKEDNVKS